jgi:fermentation-respiration switch protein FrsA (DUF1100 family)
MAQDPPKLAASLKGPLLIVQGDQDLQVTLQDARALVAAQPKAKLAIVRGVNHVLKVPSGEGRERNFAAYADPSLPIAPAVVDAVARFVKP